MLRTLAERLARGTVVRRRLRVGGESATLFVSPDSQLKYAKPGDQFDQDLIALAESRVGPSDVVWDVGANVGVFTFAAALRAKTGTVVAFEADPWLVGIMERTRSRSPFARQDIRIAAAAIGDRDGIARFSVSSRGRARSSLASTGGRAGSGETRTSLTVPMLRLDSVLDTTPTPRLVKIDVEGAELLVLAGATRLLREVRPEIFIEIGAEQKEGVRSIADANHYALNPASDKLGGIQSGLNYVMTPRG